MRKQAGRVGVGAVLTVAALALAAHAWNAARAQTLYYRAKFGAWRNDPVKVLGACDRAQALYPWNYAFCAWAGESAFYRGGPVLQESERVSQARRWCDAGLALNPNHFALRVLDVRLTERTSINAAVAKWEDYVDWNFWDPYNQFLLMELYSRAGRYDAALGTQRWLRGTPYEQRGRRLLHQAWQREISEMQAIQSRQG